jgi:putative acetyltransferase
VPIREERPEDLDEVSRVHHDAFGSHGAVVVDLVAALRRSLVSEPGLSIVAVDGDDRVVGHALFTRNLLDAPTRLVDVQVLSPVGVLPSQQRRGVGTALISRGLEGLTRRHVPLVFLAGSPAYYARFGFTAGRGQGFRRPSLRLSQDAFQVKLLEAYEPWMTGTLVYRQEFWDYDVAGPRRDGDEPGARPEEVRR